MKNVHVCPLRLFTISNLSIACSDIMCKPYSLRGEESGSRNKWIPTFLRVRPGLALAERSPSRLSSYDYN